MSARTLLFVLSCCVVCFLWWCFAYSYMIAFVVILFSWESFIRRTLHIKMCKFSYIYIYCRQLSFAWCLLCPCLLFGLGPWVIPDILWLLILSIHNIGTRFGALIFWTSHLGSGFKDDTRLKLDSRGSLESLLNMPLLNAFHGGMNDNYILAV